MMNFTSLLLELFQCKVAYVRLYAPTANLKRLIDQIDEAQRKVFSTAGLGIIGDINSALNASQLYNNPTANRIYARYSNYFDDPQTPAQSTLNAARACLSQAKLEDHDEFNRTRSKLAQQYPLEALALIL